MVFDLDLLMAVGLMDADEQEDADADQNEEEEADEGHVYRVNEMLGLQ